MDGIGMVWQTSNSKLAVTKNQAPAEDSKISFMSRQPLFISLSVAGVMILLMGVCVLWDICMKRIRLNALRLRRGSTPTDEKGNHYEEAILKTPCKTPKTNRIIVTKEREDDTSTSETDDSDEKSPLPDIDPQAAFSPYHLAWTTPMPGVMDCKKTSSTTSTAAKALFVPSSDTCTIINEKSLTDDSIERGMYTINECSSRDSIESQERSILDVNSCDVVTNSPEHMTKTMSKTGFTSGYASQLSERISPPMSTPTQLSHHKIRSEGERSFQTPRLNSTTSSDYVFSVSSQFQCNQTPIFSIPENTPLASKLPKNSQRLFLDSNVPCSMNMFRRLSSEEVSTPMLRKYNGPTPAVRRVSSSEECAETGGRRPNSGLDDSLMWDSFQMRSSSESLLWDDYLLNPPSQRKAAVYDQHPHCNDLTYLSISVVDHCSSDLNVI
ncbi:uncharacterized protein LOC126832651 [Patella vulgata]|uniref:uncharacterized protein LOC126832651 n=1 Tax=Patella vulgata TaxID=6465 RepID=UPI00217F35A2|nr:uncharacterized protein LOC126832651 [Patella vulgata]